MPVKIRLSKRGRKKLAFYHIVVADSRAPRDGKSIERIGSYNPGTNPATIELDFDRALDWLQKGAQPTDTCRSILSKQGVMYKKHLLEGVKKGAFNEEEAESRFKQWITDKLSKEKALTDKLAVGKADEAKKRFEAESKVREAKAEMLAKKLKAEAEAEAKAKAEVTEQGEAEAKAEPEIKAEAAEAKADAEAKPEVKTETAEAEAKPVVKTEAAEAEAKPEVKTEAAEAEAEAKPEAKTEAAEAEAKPEGKPEVKAEAEVAEAKAPSKPKVEDKAEVKTDAKPEAKAKGKGKAKPKEEE